jgi:AcrR family transcriptional regulator
MSSLARSRPLTANQQNRRDRILAATRELVAQQGYDGMIMRDVATLANVSPTTLYNLYNTKDELLLAALRDKLTENLRVAAPDSFAQTYDYFAAQLQNSVRQTQESPAYAHAITQALMRANPGDPMVEYLIHNVQIGLLHGLEVMAARGELREGAELQAVAKSMTGAFWGTHLMLSKQELALSDLENTLNRSFISLLLPICRPKVRKDLEARYAKLAGG